MDNFDSDKISAEEAGRNTVFLIVFLIAVAVVVLIGLLIAKSAQAENLLGGDIHLLQKPGDQSTLTPEYWWEMGECGGFGFADILSRGSLEWITNHAVDCTIGDGPFFLSGEAGISNFGPTFKAGAGIKLKNIPGFVFVGATIYPLVSNRAGDEEQVKFTWLTDQCRFPWFEDIYIYFAGFLRIRDGIPDLAQPQIWVTRNKRWEVGTEIERFGQKNTVKLAAKLKF